MAGDPFWSLSGPTRFAENVASRMLATSKGILGVTVPSRHPRGFVDAVVEAIRDRGAGRAILVSAGDRALERSIPHGLARAGGIREMSIHSVSSFLDLPDLTAASFVIEGIDREAWGRWSTFLRSFAAESQGAERSLAPRIVVLLPVDLPRSDVRFLFGKDEMQWRAYVSPTDTRSYVAKVLGHIGTESLLERIAAETIVSLSGWDCELASALAGFDIERLADPVSVLSELTCTDSHPCWSNGLIDEWDGVPFIHSLSCLSAGDLGTLKRRIWRAHSTAVTPFIAEVVDYFVDLYREILIDSLPYAVETKAGTKYVKELSGYEVSHVYHILNERVSKREATFLKSVVAVRNKVAHYDPVPASHLISLSEAWEGIRTTKSQVKGWDWPRSGQKLVLMVGPSGAGKTTLASRMYPHDSIVSSDAIRIEKYGTDVVPDQSEVFREVVKRALRRLADGETVVIDATNLRQRDRLAIVDRVPSDIRVVYLVIDRPLKDKIATGGWRLEREGLIEGHAELFEQELPKILAGDNRPNVEVVDHR